MFRFDRFEELRKERGITKTFIAKQLGRGPSLCQSWKDGKATPSPEQLKFVADILGVTPDYLMGETDERYPGYIPDDVYLEVSEMISDLSLEDLRKVEEYIAFLKSREGK